MNTDEMITAIDYIRDLAPDAEGWAQEQIANDLDQRDAEIEKLRKLLAEVDASMQVSPLRMELRGRIRAALNTEAPHE